MTRTIPLKGEIDVATVPPLREEIYAAIEANGGQVLTLDLSELEFIDSTGLGLLVGALKRARLGGGDLVITRPVAHVWKVFTVTGLDKVFKAATIEPD